MVAYCLPVWAMGVRRTHPEYAAFIMTSDTTLGYTSRACGIFPYG